MCVMWVMPYRAMVHDCTSNGRYGEKQGTCLGPGVRLMPTMVAMITRGAARAKGTRRRERRDRVVTTNVSFSGCVAVVGIVGAAGCGSGALVGGDDLVEG